MAFYFKIRQANGYEVGGVLYANDWFAAATDLKTDYNDAISIFIEKINIDGGKN